MLIMLNAHGQDSHQGGQIDHRTGQENCKWFLPLLENMIIFMMEVWYDFQLENETQSTTDS